MPKPTNPFIAMNNLLSFALGAMGINAKLVPMPKETGEIIGNEPRIVVLKKNKTNLQKNTPSVFSKTGKHRTGNAGGNFGRKGRGG